MQATKTTAQRCSGFYALGKYLSLRTKIPTKLRPSYPAVRRRTCAAHTGHSTRRKVSPRNRAQARGSGRSDAYLRTLSVSFRLHRLSFRAEKKAGGMPAVRQQLRYINEDTSQNPAPSPPRTTPTPALRSTPAPRNKQTEPKPGVSGVGLVLLKSFFRQNDSGAVKNVRFSQPLSFYLSLGAELSVRKIQSSRSVSIGSPPFGFAYTTILCAGGRKVARIYASARSTTQTTSGLLNRRGNCRACPRPRETIMA